MRGGTGEEVRFVNHIEREKGREEMREAGRWSERDGGEAGKVE